MNQVDTAPDPVAVKPVLSVSDLTVHFGTPEGIIAAADGVSFDLYPGETLGIVGESGSGKSVSLLSLLGLIPQPPGRVVSGRVLFDGRDLLGLSASQLRRIRGRDIAMVFQDPLSSLNPVMTTGWQITEALRIHDKALSRRLARHRAVELLTTVGIPDPQLSFRRYPHEYSGGMRQRVLIAMAMAHRPRVLIADEPTTALDVTVQAQVLRVLKLAQQETGAATILITHDLGVIAELADRVMVMYAGKIVESGTVEAIFHRPKHPYTAGLLESRPRLDRPLADIRPIGGAPPDLSALPPGCSFHPRCAVHDDRASCQQRVPDLLGILPGHHVACHVAHESADVQHAAEVRNAQ